MNNIQHKACELADFKLLDVDAGSFEGYGSTWDNVDRSGEAVVKGAFLNSLEDFKRDGFIATGHEWAILPVATIEDAHEDEHGLYIKGQFHSTPEAQAARTVVTERLNRGKSVGLSIGYVVVEAERVKDVRLLKEINLYEVSLVTVPCNPKASATSVKSSAASEAILDPDLAEELALPPVPDTDMLEDFPSKSFEDHALAVGIAAKAFIDRATWVQALRAKQGRQLSAATRTRLQDLHDHLEAGRKQIADLLLEADAPKHDAPGAHTPDNTSGENALTLEMLSLEAALLRHKSDLIAQL